MPSPEVEFLWIINSSWKWMVCVATRCTLKVPTPLPIRIATPDARAGMGLGHAVFAWRVPRRQSGDGLAFCGCSRAAKKERPGGVGIAVANCDGPCGRHCGGDRGRGARRGGGAGSRLAD